MASNFKSIIIKFFSKNIMWKLFSLFISMALWFLVMNINNPTEIRTFTTKLTILNEEELEENNIKVINLKELEEAEVKIKIKGTRQALTELTKKTNKERIVASLNLSQFKSVNISSLDEFISNIEINLPNLSYTYEISSIDPVTSIIQLDKISTIKKNVTIKENGTVREGLAISEVTLSTNEVEITGAKSDLDKIEGVFLEINLEDIYSDVSKSVEPIAYDISGNKIEGIEFNPSKITANIPVYSKQTIAITEPTLKGNVKDGFSISSIEYSPQQLNIFIKEENLNKVGSSITPTVNVEGLSESTTFTLLVTDFLKDQDVIYENPVEIKIAVNIEKINNKIEKEIIIPFSQIEFINKNENTEINGEDLTVKLSGTSEVLNQVSAENIKATVDLKNISEGEHTLEVQINLNEEITLLEPPMIKVLVTEKLQEPLE